MSKIVNIPELRFKEFSGEWEEKKLGELGTFKGGGTPSKKQSAYWMGDIPWISSSDINEDCIHKINISRFINLTSIKESATKIIPKNSILFVSRVGVGKLAINKKALCTSQDFTNFIPFDVDSYYLGYFFQARTNLLKSFNQGTSIKGFTKSDIEKLKLHLPSKPEQQKIASFLTTIDTKIEQLTKKVELQEQYKKGVMQKIFNQEIRFKRDDGSEFDEWEEKRLGAYIEEYKEKSTINNQYEVLTSSNRGLVYQKEYFTEGRISNKDNLGFNIIPKDYITYRSRSDNRKFTFNINNLGVIGIISTYYPVFKFINGNNKFFVEFLNFKSSYLGKYSVGTSQTVLSLNEIKKIKLNLPSLPEQTKIANFLSTLDKQIDSTKEQLAKTKEFKKGLLQRMFV